MRVGLAKPVTLSSRRAERHSFEDLSQRLFTEGYPLKPAAVEELQTYRRELWGSRAAGAVLGVGLGYFAGASTGLATGAAGLLLGGSAGAVVASGLARFAPSGDPKGWWTWPPGVVVAVGLLGAGAWAGARMASPTVALVGAALGGLAMGGTAGQTYAEVHGDGSELKRQVRAYETRLQAYEDEVAADRGADPGPIVQREEEVQIGRVTVRKRL